MSQEPDRRIRAIWESHLGMEIERLRVACEMMRRYEGIEAEEILPGRSFVFNPSNSGAY